MTTNPLKQLEALGQSVWLDYIQRSMITSGKLKQFIEEDGLRGITSNPAIFEKAFADSKDYAADIAKMSKDGNDIDAIYAALTQKDVGDAADAFLALYQATDGGDGYVSLEVNPHLAHDTEGTLEEARRLWKSLNRRNVFIKVPATKQGLPAIQQLISEGININVTLLFGLPRYAEVAEAYIAGLEARAKKGLPLKGIASVASFFLSRIDVLIDPLLKQKNANEWLGETAIASAKLAYQHYRDIFTSDRFKNLQSNGAQVQRLLWASTGTKNPDYSDVKYVEALIGPQTVNTLPMDTLEDYRDHGKPMLTLESDLDKAKAIFKLLPTFNIDIDIMTQQLEDEGVEKFNKAYDQLIGTLQKTVKEKA
jgi:transaldolase